MRTALLDLPVGEDDAIVTVLCRLGTARENAQDGSWDVPFWIIPDILETPFNPATMAPAAPPVLNPVDIENDIATPAQPAQAVQVTYPGGGKEVRVRYSTAFNPPFVEAIYRRYTGTTRSSPLSMTEVNASVFDFA